MIGSLTALNHGTGTARAESQKPDAGAVFAFRVFP